MNTTLETLIQLQAVDAAITVLQQKFDEFPEIMQQLEQQLAEHENKIQEMQIRLEDQEKNRRMKELDVESRIDKIKKYQGQLLAVKNNKEYAALLAEINSLKSQNSLAEDDIIELMEGIERAKKAIVETRREVEHEKNRISQVRQEQEKEHKQLQQRFDAEQKRRDQLVETIEEKVLKEYSKLLKLRNGIAVAPVEEEGVCTGCHVALTPQMFAEVKTGDYLHRCPICFRFVYWSNNSRPQEEDTPH